MLDVFLCHSSSDRAVAQSIAACLEVGAEARVILDECSAPDGDTVANRWDAGVSAGAILLLLSADSVPPQPTRKNWEELLHHLELSGEPQVGFLRLEECRYPPMLERRRFFSWGDDLRGTLRAMQRWLLTLHPSPSGRLFVPAELPNFSVRQEDLEPLWDALVDGSGSFRVGDSRLAQVFARNARTHFRDVLWVGCHSRHPISIVGELGVRLGLPMECNADEAARKVGSALDEHRVLVVLDGLEGKLRVPREEEGRSSVLLVSGGEPGRAEPGVKSRLATAISACSHNDFPVGFALRLADIGREELGPLVAQGLVEPLDEAGERFRRLYAGNPQMKSSHAETVSAIFRDRHPSVCSGLVAEYEAALDWALASDWGTAVTLGERGVRFLKGASRWPEAALVCKKLKEAAEWRGDSDALDEFAWELSWIEDEPGQLRRAWTAHEQQSLFT